MRGSTTGKCDEAQTYKVVKYCLAMALSSWSANKNGSLQCSFQHLPDLILFRGPNPTKNLNCLSRQPRPEKIKGENRAPFRVHRHARRQRKQYELGTHRPTEIDCCAAVLKFCVLSGAHFRGNSIVPLAGTVSHTGGDFLLIDQSTWHDCYLWSVRCDNAYGSDGPFRPLHGLSL